MNQLITDISRGDLILPEFQRGYVWTQTQVRQFLDSLYHGYPTGSFLIWKTPNPGMVRGDATDSDGKVFQLILDGQQRLTSLYALITGEAPPFYEGESLHFNIYFNVVTQEFSYFKPTVMKGAREWLPVTTFLKAGIGDYLGAGGPFPPEDRDYLFQFFSHLQQLDAIKKYTYYLDILGERNMDEVVRIFNLVNSGGTRLSKTDLALSHICALWPEARQIMRATQAELTRIGFAFGLEFYVRLTASVATGSGFYEPLYRASVEKIQEAWHRARGAIDYLVNVLRFDAFIDSNRDLSSDIVLVPLVVYLANGSGKFADNRAKRRSIADYIAAGESTILEFKGSLRWDFRQRQVNKVLEKMVAKTIAAFMNSEGGTLVIGVSDEGAALGIEEDFATLGSRGDRDGWEQALRSALNSYLSREIAALVDLTFADFEDKTVAVIHANPTRRPVYLMDGQNAEFYVRSGNTTQPLNVKQAHDYIRDRFPAVA
ncbi:MAG: DUF262 domain-containing protein [Chloroflexota bacterium]|nr:DUF262 domain-containing protein [Chloroflexota bacterium]